MTTQFNKRFNLRSGVAGVSLAFAAAFSMPLHAQTLPAGAIIESGQAGISASGANSLIINQVSPHAIISWDRFSVGHGAAVHFENGAGATLNRVRGNIGSQIDGRLSATGSLYLVNPAGITIGSSGQIETGGHFFASTLDLSDENFTRASRGKNYVLKGDSAEAVINLGKIGASGGDIVLAARTVENNGEILAPNGTAALVAGTEVLVQDRSADNGQFIVKVGGSNTRAINSGVIQATQVELRANGGNVYALAGNRDGLIAATGIAAHQGRIFLTAGDKGTVDVSGRVIARQISENGVVKKGGDVRVSGRTVKIKGVLDASGTAHLFSPPVRPDNISAGDGGQVVVTGDEIALTSGSMVDVSGARGGTALIGGDYQGGADPSKKYVGQNIATARTVSVEDWAIITADGYIGDGGRIVLWADDHTDFSGHISAASLMGQGGDAEVSGKETLRFNGTSNLLGGEGAGTLLLDPYNLTIVAGSGGDVTSSSTVSTLGADTLTTLLAGQNVVVQTGSGDGSPDLGDITVDAAINWGSGGAGGTSLTLKSHNNIILNANITATDTNSTVTLRADADSTGVGTVIFGGSTYVDASQVAILYNPAGGYKTPEDALFRPHANNLTAYMLVNDINDLQRIGDASNGNLSGKYALGRDIEASVTANPAASFGPNGFMPIGSQATPFTGVLNGRGHVIKGLTINRSATDDVGLFGAVRGNALGAGAVDIYDLGLEDASISGRDNVGALIGSILEDTYIGNISVSSYVSGRNQVGGLLGRGAMGGALQSNVNDVRTAGIVTATGQNVGGVIGSSTDIAINNSYATAVVVGNNVVGGFSGYSTGSTFQNIYATGHVTAFGANVGGLIGELDETSSVYDGYWDIDTTGQLAGKTGSGMIVSGAGIHSSTNTINAFSADTYAGFDFLPTGSWAMISGQTRPMLRMELDVIGNRSDGTYTITNAHQLQSLAVHAEEGRTLSKTYTLANNIDLNFAANNNSEIWRTAVTKDADDSYGFAFIGSESTQFHGILDGKGHTINGLVINQPLYEAVGLIGYASDKATIKNIGLTGGTVYGRNEVGSLVGINHGAIANAYSQVDVRGVNWVGGLVGRTTQFAIINTAYASGNVIGTGQYTGGFAGESNSTITNAYASGNVTGNAVTGGFAGLNSGIITNVYATGVVTGDSNVGGILGSNTGTIDHSFWNTDAKTVGIGDGTGDVTGLTFAQFQNTTYFMKKASEWDFENVWAPPGSGFSAELYALSKVIRIHADNVVTATYGSSSGAWIGSVPTGVVYGANLNITGETNYGSPDAFTAYPILNYGGLMGSNLIAQINGLNESGANGYRFIYTALAEITPASPTPPPPVPRVAALNAHECHIINKNAEVGLIDEGINISATSTLVGGDSENETVAVLFGAPTRLNNLNCNPDFFE